jgi:Glycosyltransferase
LPPLEAMASGVPALVTSRASLPEIAGDGAVAIDPERPDDTAMKLAAMLEDGALREEFARRGVARAARFTWRKCAEATLLAYRAAAAG